MLLIYNIIILSGRGVNAMNATDYVDKIEFYELLSEDEKKLVRDNVYIKEYEKNETVHSCTGACLGMIYVIRGSIRTSIISEEGRELTLFKIGQGDTCVISAACVLHEIRLESFMRAETDTTVLVLSSKALVRLVAEDLAVKSYCYEIATRRFSAALFVLQEMILLRFDQRLAKYLIGLAEKTNSRKLRITQEAIAADVNSAREVVTRMLKQFELEGLVKLSRGIVELTDVEGLRVI